MLNLLLLQLTGQATGRDIKHKAMRDRHLQVAIKYAEGGGHEPDVDRHWFAAPLHPGVHEAAPCVVHQEHGKEQRLIGTHLFI